MALRVKGERDPLLDHTATPVQRDQYIYNDMDLRQLVHHNDRDEWCGARSPLGSSMCSRANHPAWWQHVSANGDYILRVWNDGVPVPDTGELIDPEDGTPTDPAELMTADQVKLGYCYRLRDRENQLYVIGGIGKYVRADNQMEVLDLKRREFRVVPLAEMVPSDYLMSPDELSYAVEYVAHVRDVVRSEAISMYRKDKWCRDGLQAAFKELGVAPHVIELYGDMVIRIPWNAPEGSLKAKVQDVLREAVAKLELELHVPLGESGPVELDPTSMTVNIENVARR